MYMYLWVNLHKYSCLTGTWGTQKMLLYTVVEVGDGIGQVPANCAIPRSQWEWHVRYWTRRNK